MALLFVFDVRADEPLSTGSPAPSTIHTTERRPCLLFDDTADEETIWSLIMPAFTGAVKLNLFISMASATTGAARWEVLVEAVTPSDALDLDAAASFDSTNSAAFSAPATAGYMDKLSLTLTNKDGVAEGDLVRIKVRRDADGTTGTDDATGDAQLMKLSLTDAA